MEISNLLQEFSDKKILYYYSNINKKEFIFVGDENGNIFDIKGQYPLGSLIVNTLNNSDTIVSLIEKYIKIISEDNRYSSNESVNQTIVLTNLIDLENDIKKLNIDVSNYLDFIKLLANKYLSLFSSYSLKKIKYQNSIKNIDELKKLKEENLNLDYNKLTNDLKIENKKLKKYLDSLEITFKDFVLHELDNYITNIEAFDSKRFYYLSSSVEKDNFIRKHSINPDQFEQITNVLKINDEFSKTTCFTRFISLPEITTGPILVNLFNFETIFELLNLSIVSALNKNIPINKCFNCGNYFIPNGRSDEKYCDDISPQNPQKTCKEYGSKKAYRDSIKSKPIKKEHERTMQFFRMRIHRARKSEKFKEEEKITTIFNKYKKAFERKNRQNKQGILSDIDFIKWIISQKNI